MTAATRYAEGGLTMHSEYKVISAKNVPVGDLEKTLNNEAKDGWRITQIIQEPQLILVERLAGQIQTDAPY
jgi:hypothetical protein